MSISETSTLERFHRFLGEQLQLHPEMKLSPEQALALWHDREKALAAIQEGLADIEAGRTITLEEFKREFAAKYGVDRK